MARIELDNLAHSYQTGAAQREYALHPFSHTWEDGQTYALLGPSGCGKTTLLNIMSGLVRPSEGTVRFNGLDVTALPTARRNIAQVFQFPVIYRTMTVFENLAFPLRCRGLAEQDIRTRVNEVADLLNLGSQLHRSALHLTADAKQLISLGRGLVRNDVAAILFDEPLTVIDPQLKFELRRKLKEANQRYCLTMIYVTHDQAEAMTLANKVMVMNHGRVVQVGTPQELFEQPQDSFVGYFIGSPAMNMLECRLSEDGIRIGNQQLRFTGHKQVAASEKTRFAFGVRPEYVTLSASANDGGLPVRLIDVKSVGAFRIVALDLDGQRLRAKIAADVPIPSGGVFVRFAEGRRLLYADDRLVGCD
ncbi:MAG: ABC transporter ATP-binding protein [Burkholderiales bacterium RIFCSPLOWO2_02_FULL_57_36]|nr:MAG: ABC transporter ATP-binding protein [Burkholderiales bacterium RIFCSPLOWO2_02_FULL_57_36]